MADDRAFELLGGPDRPGPFVFTCEHASSELPPELAASAADRSLAAEHWGWDIGARDVLVRLVERFGGQAVLGRFSRLVVDLNRSPEQPSYVVREIAGRPLDLNADIGADEIARRTAAYFEPYHDALDRLLARTAADGVAVHLLSVHSFTPVYLDQLRAIEVGILHDEHEAEAREMLRATLGQGFVAALNQPYSGQGPDGLIYSVRRHARAHRLKYLELEVRQDLICTRERARVVADRLAVALETFRP